MDALRRLGTTTLNAKRAKVAKKISWISCFAGFAAFAFHVRRSRVSGYGPPDIRAVHRGRSARQSVTAMSRGSGATFRRKR